MVLVSCFDEDSSLHTLTCATEPSPFCLCCHPDFAMLRCLWLLLHPAPNTQVESEDTVLFTATAYVKHLSDPQQQQAARQALAPLIRCQHLSQYWQTVSALSGDEDRVLLRDYAPQLQRLLLMRVANAPLGVTRDTIQASVVNKLLPAAPASWTLPRRNIVPIVADAATVSWRLPIKDVKSLVRETAEQREGRVLRAPNKTAPLKGMTFIPVLQSIWQNGQTKLLVGAGSVNVPKGAFYNFGFTCTVEGLGILPEEEKKTGLVNSEQAAGSRIAVLCDGWDAAAWAQTGLPASGDIVFKLTVTKVCHAL